MCVLYNISIRLKRKKRKRKKDKYDARKLFRKEEKIKQMLTNAGPRSAARYRNQFSHQ